MTASHGDRRIINILELIKSKFEESHEKEVLSLTFGDFGGYDNSLKDGDLLDIAFSKIAEMYGDSIRIEIRKKNPMMTVTSGLTYQAFVWVYVSDQDKLDEHLNTLIGKVALDDRKVSYILDSEGYLYEEGKEIKHKLRKGGIRHEIILFLINKKRYVPTAKIAEHVGITPTMVRKKIDEIRMIVAQKLNLPRESLFESDGVSGYRVLNVTLKDAY